MDVTPLIASPFMAKYVKENCTFSPLEQGQIITGADISLLEKSLKLAALARETEDQALERRLDALAESYELAHRIFYETKLGRVYVWRRHCQPYFKLSAALAYRMPWRLGEVGDGPELNLYDQCCDGGSRLVARFRMGYRPGGDWYPRHYVLGATQLEQYGIRNSEQELGVLEGEVYTDEHGSIDAEPLVLPVILPPLPVGAWVRTASIPLGIYLPGKYYGETREPMIGFVDDAGNEQIAPCCAKGCDWNWLTLEPLADDEGPERSKSLVELRNIVMDIGGDDPAALFREFVH